MRRATFLSQPRRFDKSLFLNTLVELFEVNETLFRGLVVHGRWGQSRRYPVLRISCADGVLHELQALDVRIVEILVDNERALGVRGKHESFPRRFGELIWLAAGRHDETGGVTYRRAAWWDSR